LLNAPALSARGVPAEDPQKVSKANRGVEVERVTALPPLPPGDMLDVRVSVDDVDTWQIPKSAEPTDYPMLVQGLQPFHHLRKFRREGCPATWLTTT